MSSPRILSIDAGQTGVKVRVPGAVPDRIYPGIRTDEPLLPQLAAVARDAVARDPHEGAHVDTVTAGVSGLTAASADPAALVAMLDETGIVRAAIAHDSITSYLGALGAEPGAVVAAGGGVVTLAVGRSSIARVDGWGYLMGDAGSGFWIGREALVAVMRAHDGRGPQTALTDVVAARWPDLETAYVGLQADERKVSVIASFAEPVAAAADDGDAVALDITRRAARELAGSAVAGLERVGLAGVAAPVCAIGGVFRSARLRSEFEGRVLERASHARVVSPRGAGIDGVALLAQLGQEHPLSASIHRSW